jgi:hypothetical protein
MQTEIAAIAVQQGQGQERGLRNGERAARGGVGSVAVRVVGDEQVVGVVAAVEEKTNERFVIGGVEGRGAEAAEIENGIENAGRGQSGAGSLAEESAASSRRGHNYLSMTNSGELTTR